MAMKAIQNAALEYAPLIDKYGNNEMFISMAKQIFFSVYLANGCYSHRKLFVIQVRISYFDISNISLMQHVDYNQNL